tara:strand:+ start:293 stop:1258 length:966 start_codon:yes stop_codon:yes gene_type:complete
MSQSKPVEKTVNNNLEEEEEDHLEVDKPVPGQNFACVSFLSPEKVLKSKEEFTFYNYHKCKTLEHNKRLKTNMEGLLKKAENNTLKISDVVHLKKNMEKGFDLDTISFEEWKEKYEDFLFSKGQEIGEVFDKANNFRTSVRGVKVRGTYDTYREAEIRAKVLQKNDPLFDVFVGQVGYWLAWSPDTNLMENQEHSNEELNSLMKGKKENATQRDMFYEERKREMKKAAAEENAEIKLKNKKMEEETQKLLDDASLSKKETSLERHNKVDNEELNAILNGSTTDVSTTSTTSTNAEEDHLTETVDSLQESDPWLQRKTQNSN